MVLPNGARLYVDHAHPEYSTPEATSPLDVVRFDKAGELVMAAAARQVERPSGTTITLYKNNTDNKSVSYGAHENYLMSRQTPFSSIVSQVTPFFVTRQVGRDGALREDRGRRTHRWRARPTGWRR